MIESVCVTIVIEKYKKSVKMLVSFGVFPI